MRFKKTYDWDKIKTATDALLWSIAKWHLLYEEGPVIVTNCSSCACCLLYEIRSNDICKGCPVERYTNIKSCGETPYAEASRALSAGDWSARWKGEIAAYKQKFIKDERDFLIKVYNKYFDEFVIKEFEQGPYRLMKKYLMDNFKQSRISVK